MPRDGILATARSMRALDLFNFFMADIQTGFGPFVAVFLTTHKWTQAEIGFILSVGTITSVASQIPAGAIVDAVTSKRGIAAAGVLAVAASALLLVIWPISLSVVAAEVIHGFASSLVSLSIAAMSLLLVGRAALGGRLGRNAAWAAAGNGLAAAVMGGLGSTVGSDAVFWLTAALALPALIALSQIRPGAGLVAPPNRPRGAGGLRALLADRRLIVFAAGAALFHLANAAMLPLAAVQVTREAGDLANLIIAACIVVPQLVVMLGSVWVGQRASLWGRRPILLLGWGALPVRGVLLALLPAPGLLIAIQAISGVSAAVFGVMLPLIAADLTRGTGHFNLCMGVFSLCGAAGATLSTGLAGWIGDTAGDPIAFLTLAAAGLAGMLLLWIAMPETSGREMSCS